ncbi:MAG: SLBB domain-containing protein [Methylotenera sp.]|nr:SLBB domain-containing protein [Oligoflexia bacterium]
MLNNASLRVGYAQMVAWTLIYSIVLPPFLKISEAHSAPRKVPTKAVALTPSKEAKPAETPTNREDSIGVEPGGTAGDLELSPGFLIQVASAQDQNLNGTFRIQPDGVADLPYKVRVDTNGMNLAQLRSEILKVYRPYFKGTPNVQVSVKQKRFWIEVRGLVQRPGTYLVKQDAPLDEIIALSGGLADDVTTGFVRIEQGKETHVVDLHEYFKLGKSRDVPLWKGADRIFFQSERPDSDTAGNNDSTGKIHVLGEVRAPGEQTFRRKADGYYYLIRTGGPTERADLDKVEQIRTDRKTGERKIVHLGLISELREIQETDILIVHPDRPSEFNKFLQSSSLVASILTAALVSVIAVRQFNK